MRQHGYVKMSAMLTVLAAAGAFAQEGPPQSPMPAGGSSYGSDQRGSALIQYDSETGTVIVIADEETNEEISRVIESLDQPVPQVLIKVLFLEVTHGKDLDLGVEGFLQDLDTSLDFVQGGEIVDRSRRGETAFGLAAESRGAFYQFISDDANLTIRALESVGDLEVLSRPSILTRNNQEATITVGQEVPFIRNSRVTQDGQTINTIEYEDIGIILEVTPHITPDSLVAMEVLPEISTLTGETVRISDTVEAPVFAKRSAETGVVVPDGKTVVIGGLMEDNETKTVRRVPILGKIPWLGALFRRTITSKTKTELLIFLTPHVVRGASELREMSVAERDGAELVPEVFSSEQVGRYIGDLDTPGELEP